MKVRSLIPIITFFLFWSPVICSGILVSCKKKEVIEPIDYSPVQLKTTTYSNLEGKQVTLNGSIEKLNGLAIEDYGFILQKKGMGTSGDGKEIISSLGSKATVGDVTLKYQHGSNFELGDRFQYTLYVKTKNGFYRGESNFFIVDGITINLVEDKMVPNNNQITVTGDFQFLSENIKLYYRPQYSEENSIPYQIASDKKSLTFTVPKSDKFYHGNNISFFLRTNDNFGFESNRTIANIQVLGVLNPPAKKKMYLNEILEIEGPGLKWSEMSSDSPFYIIINDKKIAYRSGFLLYEISGLKGDKFQLGYDNGKDVVVFKDSIELIKPIGSNMRFEKKAIHSPSLMQVNGMDMYTYIMNPEQPKYYLGKNNITHRFNSSYGDPQAFAVRNVPDGIYNFTYNSPFYSATSTEQIEVRNLRWDTPNNIGEFLGEPFTITGNFIDGEAYIVTGNGIDVFPIAKDGKIVFQLPSYIVGATEIQIGYLVNINYNEKYFVPKKQSLYVKNFIVNDISTLQGYPGDVVTINGRGLNYLNITVDGAYATSFFRSSEKISFIVPAFAKKGKVEIVLTSNQTTVKYKDLFEIL